MEYTTVRLGGKAGLIAIGRNLNAVAELQSRLIAAQQAMEQEYWKLREVETRYRVLFDASNEAVLLLKADTPAHHRGQSCLHSYAGAGAGTRPAAGDSGGRARTVPGDAATRSSIPAGRPAFCCISVRDRAGWLVRAALMTSEPGPVFLVQLAPAGTVAPAPGGKDEVPIR